MKFDDILRHLGEFGPYQKRLYFILCIPMISTGFHAVISVFLIGTPDHRCAIPGLDNDTYAVQSDYHQYLINLTIPPSDDETKTYDQCHLYNINISDSSTLQNPDKIQCTSWVYDRSVFLSTFTVKVNLVCDDRLKTSHGQMIYFAGKLVGSTVLGLASDVFGRKKTFVLSILLLLVSTMALPWSPNFVSFCIFRFLAGAAGIGLFMSGFVIGMEMVGPSKRVTAGIVMEYFWVTGVVILAGIAYALRDWFYIQLATSIPTFLYLVYWWIIPESARWLLSKNRYKEAKDVIQKAAKVNKVTLTKEILDFQSLATTPREGVWQLFTSRVLFIRTVVIFFNCKNRYKEAKDVIQKAAKVNKVTLTKEILDFQSLATTPREGVWQLFTSRVLFIRTVVIFFNWIVISMVFYGLALNSGNLGGNFYLNFLIQTLVEYPAYTICLVLMNRMGRKPLHCLMMIIGGICCICTIFTMLYADKSLQPLTITLAMLGKVGATAAFGIIYVWSAELFPTVVRNSSLGLSSTFSRFGGMASPYIADLSKVIPGNFGRALPLVIFGGASVFAGIMAIALPETMDMNLPETIEDGKQFGKKRNKYKKEKESSVDGDSEEYDKMIHVTKL